MPTKQDQREDTQPMKCSRCHSKRKTEHGGKEFRLSRPYTCPTQRGWRKSGASKLCKEEAPHPPSKVWDGYSKEWRLVEIYDHTSVLVFADCIWLFLLNAIGILFFKIPERTGIFLDDMFMVSRVTTTSSCPREEMWECLLAPQLFFFFFFSWRFEFFYMCTSLKLFLTVSWSSKGLGFIELCDSLYIKSFGALGQQIQDVLQSWRVFFFFFFWSSGIFSAASSSVSWSSFCLISWMF